MQGNTNLTKEAATTLAERGTALVDNGKQLAIRIRIRICMYIATYVHILYFVWVDQRDKVYFIFHKVGIYH